MSALSAEARLARASTFTFCAPSRDEVRLERREQEDGSVLWAILRWGSAWTRERKWEHESSPSYRTADYLKRARWTFEEAWAECERIERDLGFALPAEEVISRCLAALLSIPGVTAVTEDTGVAVTIPTDRGGAAAVWVQKPYPEWTAAEVRTSAIGLAKRCCELNVNVDLSAGAAL